MRCIHSLVGRLNYSDNCQHLKRCQIAYAHPVRKLDQPIRGLRVEYRQIHHAIAP